jgi:hypothetical protein
LIDVVRLNPDRSIAGIVSRFATVRPEQYMHGAHQIVKLQYGEPVEDPDEMAEHVRLTVAGLTPYGRAYLATTSIDGYDVYTNLLLEAIGRR